MSKHGCHAASDYQKLRLGSIDTPVAILPVGVALSYLILILYRRTETVSRPLEVVVQVEEGNATQSPPSVHDEKFLNPATALPLKFSNVPTTALRYFHYRYTVPAPLAVLGTPAQSVVEVCFVQIALIGASSVLCLKVYRQRIPKHYIALVSAWGMLLLRETTTKESTDILCVGYTLAILVLLMISLFPRPQALEKPTLVQLEKPTLVQSSQEHLTPEQSAKKLSPAASRKLPPREGGFPFTLESIFSATLLLVITAKEYVSKDVALYKERVFPFVLPLSIGLFQDAIINWRETGNIYDSTSQRARAFTETVVASTPGYLYYGLLTPLVFCGLFAAGFLITSFLTSCLGFRNLVFGLPATTPSFTDLSMAGGMLYIIVGAVNINRNTDQLKLGNKRITNGALILAEAVGQTLVMLVALAAVLSGINNTWCVPCGLLHLL